MSRSQTNVPLVVVAALLAYFTGALLWANVAQFIYTNLVIEYLPSFPLIPTNAFIGLSLLVSMFTYGLSKSEDTITTRTGTASAITTIVVKIYFPPIFFLIMAMVWSIFI